MLMNGSNDGCKWFGYSYLLKKYMLKITEKSDKARSGKQDQAKQDNTRLHPDKMVSHSFGKKNPLHLLSLLE